MNINVNVTNKIAAGDGSRIVCNNSDYTVTFELDSEWDNLPFRTLRLWFNGKYKEVAFTGNTVNLPTVEDAEFCLIGIYADDIHTSTPARFECDKSILSGSQVHTPPTEDVYNQIIALLEQIEKPDAVLYTLQTLTLGQQEQARKNIKAAHGGNRRLAQNAEEGVVDIKDYGEANMFVCPSDGYIQFRKNAATAAGLHVDNYTLATSTGNQTVTMFVAQGMHVWMQGEPNAAFFIPWIEV